MIHPTVPATAEDRSECPEREVATNRKIPVAYEEVTLTDEAVEVLKREREAAIYLSIENKI